jgi:hypothetical protein
MILTTPKMPLVYVAGPLSGVKNVEGGFPIAERFGNVMKAVEVAMSLEKLGCATHVPHAYSWLHDILNAKMGEVGDWDTVLCIDEQIILRCDCIYRIPGESAGADREEKFADANGIDVICDWSHMEQWYNEWLKRRNLGYAQVDLSEQGAE